VPERRILRALAALASLSASLAAGCVDAESAFVGNRLRDVCNEDWPVCNTAAGCVIGNGQYVPGTFPGTVRMIVQTQLSTNVSIDIFLRTEGAVGTVTNLYWFEVGCGTNYIDHVTGKDLFAKFDAQGIFTDTQQLVEPGDHLIEVSSDATADYLLKLDVVVQGTQ
jgi:hypothetical protein